MEGHVIPAFSVLLLLWALAAVFLPLSICLSDAGFPLSREGIGMGEGVALPWPCPSSTYCTFQPQPFCVGYLFLEGKCLLRGCKLHNQGVVGVSVLPHPNLKLLPHGMCIPGLDLNRSGQPVT